LLSAVVGKVPYNMYLSSVFSLLSFIRCTFSVVLYSLLSAAYCLLFTGDCRPFGVRSLLAAVFNLAAHFLENDGVKRFGHNRCSPIS
jgi:hypothetical protein